MCVLIYALHLLKEKRHEVLMQDRGEVYTKGFDAPWMTAFLMVLHSDLPTEAMGVAHLLCMHQRD